MVIQPVGVPQTGLDVFGEVQQVKVETSSTPMDRYPRVVTRRKSSSDGINTIQAVEIATGRRYRVTSSLPSAW